MSTIRIFPGMCLPQPIALLYDFISTSLCQEHVVVLGLPLGAVVGDSSVPSLASAVWASCLPQISR